jgi:hypothetical protein
MVGEAEVRLGLSLREHHELAINGTHMVIGEVIFVELPSGSMGDDGAIDLGSAGSVALSGLDTYYQPAALKRMAYAKTDLPPRVLWDASSK